jgi:hypothetical protein
MCPDFLQLDKRAMWRAGAREEKQKRQTWLLCRLGWNPKKDKLIRHVMSESKWA